MNTIGGANLEAWRAVAMNEGESNVAHFQTFALGLFFACALFPKMAI